MAELMHQMRDPVHNLGGVVGSTAQSSSANAERFPSDFSIQKAFGSNGVHTTPATNLKLTEALRNAQHDASPNLIPSKMTSSKSYTHGLSSTTGTATIPTSNSAQSNLSLLADISPNHTHFFEVMYVGKIRVTQKRVPHSFIDDSLPKFKAYDAQRSRLLLNSSSASDSSTASLKLIERSNEPIECATKPTSATTASEEHESHISCSDEDKNVMELKNNNNNGEPENCADHKLSNKGNKGHNHKLKRGITQVDLTNNRDKVENHCFYSCDIIKQMDDSNHETYINAKQEMEQELQLQSPSISRPTNYPLDNIFKERDRSGSHGSIPPYVEQNRTMVFLVGRSDLRLISPDRKQVLLYKDFKDVASCAQGQENADYFGILCRETAHNNGYISYVFKCQSDHVCDDIVAAISQAFTTCAEEKRKQSTQIFSCEHCPMLWYHKLCSDVEGLSEKKIQNMIFRRIDSLTEQEQDIIWAKFYGSEKMSSPLVEQNQFVMMLLRAHCESRQQRHVHDTAENRSEFLNQYLGGNTIFMKAKRSLTNSFDHLLKRKTSKDEVIIHNNNNNNNSKDTTIENPKNDNETLADGTLRPRSITNGSSPYKAKAEQLKSPMMDIFIKVGNSPRESQTQHSSWRQAILNSVVTPSKGMEANCQSEFLSPMRITKSKDGKRSSEELRELWQTAIRQIILLNRMETENAMLQAKQNENELKRIKLDYDEINIGDKEFIEKWEQFIDCSDALKISIKKGSEAKLTEAIKIGVPRTKRGDVWLFLAKQYSATAPMLDAKKSPNFHTPYNVLLKNLTEHQHAIFIDLGRTFPNHKFYKDPLGLGQLSLFNLLKAYSIMDPEVGYCQGLGFICGILLLHCDEAEAFYLLKHLMFQRQMRNKYLPDMKNFQLQLYQLSRLVKDHLPELYTWFDQNDVSPTLYAAPWILTIFSSQFPLGFVARVFDLLFLESFDVIFKFALALLTYHRNNLLARDNFEDIIDYLKTEVPKIDHSTLQKLSKMVFDLDISQQLMEYNIEYNVLQEEVSIANHNLEFLNREKSKNQSLEHQLQLSQSSILQLEKACSEQELQILALQTRIQTADSNLEILGRYITSCLQHRTEFEVPNEVQQILSKLDEMEKLKRKSMFTERKIAKSISINSHLGFPLKALEELNEREEHGSPQKLQKEKTPFFERNNTELRQQRCRSVYANTTADNYLHNSRNNITPTNHSTPRNLQQRPNSLYNTKALSSHELKVNELDHFKMNENADSLPTNMKSPMEVDSGVGTPLSPPSNSSNSSCSPLSHSNESHMETKSISDSRNLLSAATTPADGAKPSSSTAITSTTDHNNWMHPLCMVDDVHVQFNGTTQLKSIPSNYGNRVKIKDVTKSTEHSNYDLDLNQSLTNRTENNSIPNAIVKGSS